MRLIFLMLVFKEEAVRLHDVASHASNAWMTGVCRALQEAGVRLVTVGHEPARVWPLGRHLFPGDPDHLSMGIVQRLVRFLNVPLLRHFFLAVGYRRALCREVAGCSDAIVCTYNPLPWQVYAAQAAVKQGARWISFVLDDDEVDRHGWGRYLKQTKTAAGHVFVSQWAYEHAPVAHKLLLEGGVEAWRGGVGQFETPARAGQSPSVMFAGLLCESAGVQELVAMIDALPERQLEFWICGKGACAELTRRAAQDQRIKLLGFLSEAELDQRLQSAWVLINPRSVTHEGSRMNFPSKLLRYLSYGKPVVTVWTPGIPAEYREVLQVVDPKVCGSEPAKIGHLMAQQVDGVLQWDAAERLAWEDKVHQFIVPAKLWSSQVKRLVEFINPAPGRGSP
jgi:glycosyltransferase involved in cell wall biosynthesis